jgi:hypothetical protein
MLPRINIAIDPVLKAGYAPEICWTLRLLLTGIGWSWKEVPIDNPACDIAYIREYSQAGRARLYIRANVQAWGNRSNVRLTAVRQNDEWVYPIYIGESGCSYPWQIVDGRLICDRDLIFDVFWLATGQEEQHWPTNQHGHFDLSGTALLRVQGLRLALASQIGSNFEKTLTRLGFPAPLPRWPHGKRAAACVGHDVDYPEVVRWLEPLRVIRRQGLRGFFPCLAVLTGQRHHWHFASWAQLEQGLDIRSALYFVAKQGSLLKYVMSTPDPFYDVRSDRFKTLFQYLADEGFEIGLQASYRAFESQENFAQEKLILEEASGQSIYGNRHHYWHLDPADPESTLRIHEQIGLQYDTSLIHERYVGWRRGLSWPFFPFHQKDRRELKTLQIPTAWMDDHLFGHRQHNPGNRCEILRALVDRVLEQGGCLLVDVHDYVYDEVLFPGWAKTYLELLQLLTMSSDFWIGTPCQIADYWVKRHTSIMQASQGLTGMTGSCENSFSPLFLSAHHS